MTTNNVANRILELVKPENHNAVLVMELITLEELETSGYKLKTVYQMCPKSRKFGSRKIEYKRLQVDGYEVEFRLNTEYGYQFGADVYVHSIKKEEVVWYKAPEIHLIKV